MDRREFLKIAGVGGLSLMAGNMAFAGDKLLGGKDSKRPNIVFVMADQLGYQRCGYAGDSLAHTPNIDLLASQGINFRQAVTSMPVCAAYRASLLTGKYTTSTGMVINEIRMNPHHECLAHVLTKAGYETGYIGKWHLYANQLGNHLDPKNSFVPRGPHRLGFDGYWAAYNFHHEYYGAYYHKESPDKIFYGKDVYEPDAQTDMAIDYINARAKGDKPFCLVLSVGTPHDPWAVDNVPKDELARFKDTKFPLPPNYAKEADPYGDNWARGSRDPNVIEQQKRVYYAMTSNLDKNLGRLMTALDKAEIADDTILVFTSDHGEMFGSHGRRAKNIFYDEAARIPFLLRYPRKIKGAKSDACLNTVDIMPTLLGLCGLGVKIPKEVEGMDLSQIASGKKGAEPEAALLMNTGACAAWEDGHEWRALRDKRFTYAVYRGGGKLPKKELLFDNTADPYQQKNLIDDPKQAKTAGRFRKMLSAQMAKLNDTFPASSYYREHWVDKDRIIIASARGVFPKEQTGS
ncbi:MAG: sulfatase [Armatimonadetes bacterium]|nr:sulfatase [Armatimonadota bacterium]